MKTARLQDKLPQWQTTDQLPVSLVCGGKHIQGIPSAWNPSVTVRRIDCNLTETTVVGTSPTGLELRMECRSYQDFTAAEYTLFITNRGDTDTPIIENARLNVSIPGTDGTLYHGNGDTKDETGYEWYFSPVESVPLTVQPVGDGTSCNGAFPYMRLMLDGWGMNVAIGWTGTWTADISQAGENIFLSVGQKRFHTVIHPGETMRLPSLTLLAYAGDEDTARNTWRRWYFAHILPKQANDLLEPKCCMHLFKAQGKPEFTGATEENMLGSLNTYLQRGIRPDVWWIDAGWYPCDYVWQKTGTWHPNYENFPRGLKPIGDRCHEEGIEFLLWFEPERIWEGTQLELEHPEWIIPSSQYGPDNPRKLVDLGNPDCCDYIIDLLDGMIKEYGVDIYRQDFNFKPAWCWDEVEGPNRIGAIENQHIQGYYRMWDTLLARNPGLLIDSCASGGRRNDIETMRRSVPLHYTDVGYGNHPIKLNQHRQMFEWIPYFRAHNQNWCAEDGSYDKVAREPDRYSYYAAMAPALTDLLKYDASTEAYALAKEMQPVWRKAARLMIGTDYYPLTQTRKSSDDFYAAQFHDPSAQKGLVHMVNGSTATQTEFVVKLRGLDPRLTYTITSAEEKCSWSYTGSQLMDGITVSIPRKAADIWFLERK